MVNRSLSATLTGVLLCAAAGAAEPELNKDDDDPDMEFLEYLGMWEESDEDWQLLDTDDENEDGDSEARPQGNATTEKDDEV